MTKPKWPKEEIPRSAMEQYAAAFGKVGEWLGGCMGFPFNWSGVPWKKLLIGVGLVWLAFAVYAGWLWLQ